MRMQPLPITRLVTAPSDSDYVGNFQALADLNLELHRDDGDARLHLRKAILELDLGNFAASLESSKEALDRDGDLAEAHYQAGLASLLLAFVKAGAVPAGPGHQPPPTRSVEEWLKEAAEHLGQAVRLDPDDEEAQEDLGALSRLMARHPTSRDLMALLDS